LDKYVLSPKWQKGNGGAGVERHDFDHLVLKKHFPESNLFCNNLQHGHLGLPLGTEQWILCDWKASRDV